MQEVIHNNKLFVLIYKNKKYYAIVKKDHLESNFCRIKIWEKIPFKIFGITFNRKKSITKDATKNNPLRYKESYKINVIKDRCNKAISDYLSKDLTKHKEVIVID